jgi:hypothetical protein
MTGKPLSDDELLLSFLGTIPGYGSIAKSAGRLGAPKILQRIVENNALRWSLSSVDAAQILADGHRFGDALALNNVPAHETFDAVWRRFAGGIGGE